MPFGGGGFGFTPWGGGAGPVTITMLTSLAVRENVVRVGFNVAPAFTGLLDATDASNPDRFSIIAVAGTFGMDSLPARDVAIVRVDLVPGTGGAQLDLTLDRPMSPYPAQYIVGSNNIVSFSGALLVPNPIQFPSVLLRLPTPQDDGPQSKDFAHPDTLSDLVGTIPFKGSPVLGGMPADVSGDYAADSGLVSLKKRIMRRLATALDGFAHLQGYGVGVAQKGKKLSSIANRQTLAASAELQIALEPEVLKVRVVVVDAPGQPGLFRLSIRVKTQHFGAFKFEADAPGVSLAA